MSVKSAAERPTGKNFSANPLNSSRPAEPMPEEESAVRLDLTKPISLGTLCHPINSSDLFGGETKEIFIRHGEEMYRLTITRNGKLILQK